MTAYALFSSGAPPARRLTGNGRPDARRSAKVLSNALDTA
jgi:hypothetical protein